jgi:hypothetical protein
MILTQAMQRAARITPALLLIQAGLVHTNSIVWYYLRKEMSKATKQRESSKVCYDTIPNVRHANKLDNLIRSKTNRQTGTGFFTHSDINVLF